MSVAVMHVWGVPRSGVPQAVVRMATDRVALLRLRHSSVGLRFFKLLGTGSGETFSLRQADLRHWALLTVWDSSSAAQIFEKHPLVRHRALGADEVFRCELVALSSRGSWNGAQPFVPVSGPVAGPVASLTRARIKPRLWPTFSQAVPPVAASVAGADGLILRTGIGEAPIGLQGTFSIWESNQAINDFAYAAAHQRAIDDTDRIGWYSEELFARFAVVRASGSFCGEAVQIGASP